MMISIRHFDVKILDTTHQNSLSATLLKVLFLPKLLTTLSHALYLASSQHSQKYYVAALIYLYMYSLSHVGMMRFLPHDVWPLLSIFISSYKYNIFFCFISELHTVIKTNLFSLMNRHVLNSSAMSDNSR